MQDYPEKAKKDREDGGILECLMGAEFSHSEEQQRTAHRSPLQLQAWLGCHRMTDSSLAGAPFLSGAPHPYCQESPLAGWGRAGPSAPSSPFS